MPSCRFCRCASYLSSRYRFRHRISLIFGALDLPVARLPRLSLFLDPYLSNSDAPYLSNAFPSRRAECPACPRCGRRRAHHMCVAESCRGVLRVRVGRNRTSRHCMSGGGSEQCAADARMAARRHGHGMCARRPQAAGCTHATIAEVLCVRQTAKPCGGRGRLSVCVCAVWLAETRFRGVAPRQHR